MIFIQCDDNHFFYLLPLSTLTWILLSWWWHFLLHYCVLFYSKSIKSHCYCYIYVFVLWRFWRQIQMWKHWELFKLWLRYWSPVSREHVTRFSGKSLSMWLQCFFNVLILSKTDWCWFHFLKGLDLSVWCATKSLRNLLGCRVITFAAWHASRPAWIQNALLVLDASNSYQMTFIPMFLKISGEIFLILHQPLNNCKFFLRRQSFLCSYSKVSKCQ